MRPLNLSNDQGRKGSHKCPACDKDQRPGEACQRSGHRDQFVSAAIDSFPALHGYLAEVRAGFFGLRIRLAATPQPQQCSNDESDLPSWWQTYVGQSRPPVPCHGLRLSRAQVSLPKRKIVVFRSRRTLSFSTTVEAVDSKSRQVAAEIVEAGLGQVESPEAEPTLSELPSMFIALGNALAAAWIGTFSMGLSSVQSDEPGANELREKIAADMHREAVGVVAAGASLAAAAWRLCGMGVVEATTTVAWNLRSVIAEDAALWGPEAEMTNGQLNYVLAASELHLLATHSDASRRLDSFAHKVLDDVVGFTVTSAAKARAIESPAGQ
jgi:hypothetical protein